MTKKKVKRRGLAPAPDRLAAMHADGYGTPAEVAADSRVSASSIYTWVKAGALKAVNGKPPVNKIGPNVWVLFAAAAIKSGVGCATCGCTETRACPGGCSWVPGVTVNGLKYCSTCYAREA